VPSLNKTIETLAVFNFDDTYATGKLRVWASACAHNRCDIHTSLDIHNHTENDRFGKIEPCQNFWLFPHAVDLRMSVTVRICKSVSLWVHVCIASKREHLTAFESHTLNTTSKTHSENVYMFCKLPRHCSSWKWELNSFPRYYCNARNCSCLNLDCSCLSIYLLRSSGREGMQSHISISIHIS